jgi:hypothetical protein
MRKNFFIRAVLPILSIGALMCSCQKGSDSSTAVSETAALKPSVAVVPLIDNSEHALKWNIADEITYTLCSKLDEKHLFELAMPSKIRMQTKRMKGSYNPFGNDIEWVKQVFAEEDFVVFLELLEHREVSTATDKATSPAMSAAELKVGLRLRIIDNRADTPKVTLQEILQDSHFIPKQFNQYNFEQCSWDSEEFALSPVGMAHLQLIKELKERIEGYILMAKADK